jgi:hypothetical protein
MQQIAIFNYVTCSIDVYTIDSTKDIGKFIIDELGLSPEDFYYMTKPGTIQITIHANE